jgi:glucan 1,3-beta-glucosidase
LIESKGPSWVYSSSNEHSTLYNWQLSGAENIYLGQIQSETPYFQAGQLDASQPYGIGYFAQDPSFEFCTILESGTKPAIDTCRTSWALRVINSSQVFLYGGGFYSFYNNYENTCSKTGKTCQDRLVDISFSEEIWLYSIYTVGAKEVISPQGWR